jgi:hypothetical protein
MLEPERFYEPSHAGAEAATAERLEKIRQLKARIRKEQSKSED